MGRLSTTECTYLPTSTVKSCFNLLEARNGIYGLGQRSKDHQPNPRSPWEARTGRVMRPRESSG